MRKRLGAAGVSGASVFTHSHCCERKSRYRVSSFGEVWDLSLCSWGRKPSPNLRHTYLSSVLGAEPALLDLFLGQCLAG